MSDCANRSGAAVVASNLSKWFPAYDSAWDSQSQTRIVDDLSFCVPAGSSLALMGPSGSGKTTVLNLIGTLLTPDSGSVTVNGVNAFALSAGELARFRNERIGFLFQEHNLLPQCDVLENILAPLLAFHNSVSSEKVERAMELLSLVGLSEAANAFPENLSGGEKQRVALVRALINEPALLLADEPTGALDAGNARKLADLMFEINSAKKITLVMATHSLELASEAALRLDLKKTRENA